MSRLRSSLAAIAMAGALAPAGCGSTSHTTRSTARSGTNQTTATTATGTTATTTTGTATTATTVLPGTGRPAIALGDKNFTEQFLLGELYDLALTAEGYTVSLTRNIGPTSVSMPALEAGTLSMYPEYLNVFDTTVAGYQHGFRSQARAYGAAQRYAQAHGLVLLDATPFSDTNGIGVLSTFAQEHRLRALGDLRRVASGLTVGAPLEFLHSPSGLPAVEHGYRFTAGAVHSLDIGSQYPALVAGTIQAAFVGTTDGQLSIPAYSLLADPRHVLGFGNVVPVVTAKTVAAEGPAFVATINEVTGLLTTEAMRGLNAQVDLAHGDPLNVARLFLQQHGMLAPNPG